MRSEEERIEVFRTLLSEEERIEVFRTLLSTGLAIYVSTFGTAFEIMLTWSIAAILAFIWYRTRQLDRRSDSGDT